MFNLEFEMRNKAYNICRKFLSGEWKKISSDGMVFKTVSGGLSNYLFYCSLPATHTPLNGEPSQVLLRMYGQLLNGDDTKIITDAVVTMLLSERNLGPKLYGVFTGGRIEEYIPSRAMKCKELKIPIYWTAIARKLAEVHRLDVPINREGKWLWHTFRQWLQLVRIDSRVETDSTYAQIERELNCFDFESEIKWLKQWLSSCDSPIVFAHNDLQEGNILLLDNSSLSSFDNKIVMFIDFEYCSYNYRGFDLGNHFCEHMFSYSKPEWPHFWADLDAYPQLSYKRAFVREYMRNSPDLTNDSQTEDQLVKEGDYYSLASHLLWILWSINSARTSKQKMDFWEYGKTRLTAYINHKKQILKKYNTKELH